MRQGVLGLLQRFSRQQHWRSAAYLGVRELSYTLPEDVRQQIEQNKRDRAEVSKLHETELPSQFRCSESRH